MKGWIKPKRITTGIVKPKWECASLCFKQSCIPEKTLRPQTLYTTYVPPLCTHGVFLCHECNQQTLAFSGLFIHQPFMHFCIFFSSLLYTPFVDTQHSSKDREKQVTSPVKTLLNCSSPMFLTGKSWQISMQNSILKDEREAFRKKKMTRKKGRKIQGYTSTWCEENKYTHGVSKDARRRQKYQLQNEESLQITVMLNFAVSLS